MLRVSKNSASPSGRFTLVNKLWKIYSIVDYDNPKLRDCMVQGTWVVFVIAAWRPSYHCKKDKLIFSLPE